MVKDLNLVFGVDIAPNNTEFPENFEVFFLLEDVMHWGVNHLGWEELNEPIWDEVVDYKLVVFEELLHEVEESFGLFYEIPLNILFILAIIRGNDTLDDVGQDEHDPFADVYFEHLVIADQFCDDFVNAIVQFNKLLFLVVLLAEDGSGLLWGHL